MYDGGGYRESQRDTMARKRASERDIAIPPPKNPVRRASAEGGGPFVWLPLYLPHLFRRPFTEQQRGIVTTILSCIQTGDDDATAAPRGSGKSTIVIGLVVYCIIVGLIRFAVIVAATGPHAAGILANIKAAIEESELLKEDYPEVVLPILALEGAPQRAGMQTANGERTKIVWSSEFIVFPTVQGSRCSGSVVKTYGLDAAIRGVNYKFRRPDFVLIDDPETRESADSDRQIQTREEIIERDIGGLAGEGKRIARVLLTTIQNRKCLSWKVTDRQQKPSWMGKRLKLLEAKPEREDLWDEYMRLVQDGRETGADPNGRNGLFFYLERQEEMDRGSVVTAPFNFDDRVLEDGYPSEVSALQHCYNLIARIGWDAFCTEYQNDPPQEDNIEESGITANRIRTHLRGLDKGEIPDWATTLTAGIDVGKRALHWVVAAWGEGATGTVIDYGVAEVNPPSQDTPEGTERAIVSALLTWRDETLATPYGCKANAEGQRILKTVLVDSGWYDMAVHNFVKQTGSQLFRPSKGFGQSENMTPYKAPEAHGKKVLVGSHWHMTLLEAKGVWLVGLDADYWKRWLHDRFLTPVSNEDGTPYRGSVGLFGSDDRKHMAYAKHLTAETEVEEFVKGRGLKRHWKKVNRNNHWFDATYMSCAAASMNGVELLTKPAPPPRTQTPFQQSQRKPLVRRSLSFRR